MTRDGLTEENLRDGSVKISVTGVEDDRKIRKNLFLNGNEKRLKMKIQNREKENDCRWRKSVNLLSGRKLLRIQLKLHRKKKYPDIERNCIVMKNPG